MISADLQSSINKILPCQQHLIPVVFKRKLSYQGHFIEEWIDRRKVLAYFSWFKRYNHLFEDYKLDEKIIDEFENQAMESIRKCENHEEEDTDDDTNSDSAGCSSSVIVDKYQEDSKAGTVANHFARMIIDLELKLGKGISQTAPVTDPEENDYPEDEYDEEEDLNEGKDDPKIDDLTEDDLKIYDKVIKALKTFDAKAEITAHMCKCEVANRISHLIKVYSGTQHLKPANIELMSVTESANKKLQELIKVARELLKKKPDCNHETNDLQNMFQKLIDKKNLSPEVISDYVNQQKRRVRQKVGKIFLAPGEDGNIQNWQSDIFLEEKLFPALFPYGLGGFMSSNVIRSSNIGFANYVKSRLLCADPKFRNDPYYMFFLLLVKEMVEMLRSESTFYRKAGKSSTLTPKVLREITPEFMIRYNTAFTAFKNLRGTSMYFQAVKKNLMAFIRQEGPPTLFVTLSSAEFQWDEMLQRIYETSTNTKVSLDFIKSQDQSWKTKLASSNVVQSTMHFSKRISTLISLLTKNSPFCHDGLMYLVSDFFYRIEFQVKKTLCLICLIL